MNASEILALTEPSANFAPPADANDSDDDDESTAEEDEGDKEMRVVYGGRTLHEQQSTANPGLASQILILTEPTQMFIAPPPPLAEEQTTTAALKPPSRSKKTTEKAIEQETKTQHTRPSKATNSEKDAESQEENGEKRSTRQPRPSDEKVVTSAIPFDEGSSDLQLKLSKYATRSSSKSAKSSNSSQTMKSSDGSSCMMQRPGAIAVRGIDYHSSRIVDEPSSTLYLMDPAVETAPAVPAPLATATLPPPQPETAQSNESATYSVPDDNDEENGNLMTATALCSQEFEVEIRNRIIREAVQAEVQPEEPVKDPEQQRRWRMWIIVTVIAILIIGFIAGVTAGVLVARNNKNPADGDIKGEITTDDSIPELVELYLKAESGHLPLEQSLANPGSRQRASFNYVTKLVAIDDIYKDVIPETYALANLFLALDGYNWINANGWMNAPSVCDWEGVTCDGDNVTELTLPSNNMTGEIPAEIFFLDDTLKRLAMPSNRIRGSFIFELTALTKLTHLDLSSNQLSGTIPEDIQSLQGEMHGIDLSDNQFTGSAPVDSFMHFMKLTSLDLSQNLLTSDLHTKQARSVMRNLSHAIDLFVAVKLERIDLHSNRLTGEIPSYFALLPHLAFARLDSNFFFGNVNPAVCDRASLELFMVDCERMEKCACCSCGLLAPTMSPTFSSRPTLTPEPAGASQDGPEGGPGQG